MGVDVLGRHGARRRLDVVTHIVTRREPDRRRFGSADGRGDTGLFPRVRVVVVAAVAVRAPCG
jgi:hypothetical protein